MRGLTFIDGYFPKVLPLLTDADIATGIWKTISFAGVIELYWQVKFLQVKINATLPAGGNGETAAWSDLVYKQNLTHNVGVLIPGVELYAKIDEFNLPVQGVIPMDGRYSDLVKYYDSPSGWWGAPTSGTARNYSRISQFIPDDFRWGPETFSTPWLAGPFRLAWKSNQYYVALPPWNTDNGAINNNYETPIGSLALSNVYVSPGGGNDGGSSVSTTLNEARWSFSLTEPSGIGMDDGPQKVSSGSNNWWYQNKVFGKTGGTAKLVLAGETIQWDFYQTIGCAVGDTFATGTVTGDPSFQFGTCPGGVFTEWVLPQVDDFVMEFKPCEWWTYGGIYNPTTGSRV